ncbi:hypothetical protein TWF481_000405 [Arthrobotrys musiformis]|uniref:Uncharacterized protein n=1 Tax=Arthrobotrys musiformis TaxID=47236 RepID=A0AAV9WPR0_9PEZI
MCMKEGQNHKRGGVCGRKHTGAAVRRSSRAFRLFRYALHEKEREKTAKIGLYLQLGAEFCRFNSTRSLGDENGFLVMVLMVLQFSEFNHLPASTLKELHCRRYICYSPEKGFHKL